MGSIEKIKDMKTSFVLVVASIAIYNSEAAIDGRTFGSCDTLRCMIDHNQAQYCCNTGNNRRCCDYGGGNGGWNNGNGGYNNNKPGQCPSYNGRRKRSPEDAPGVNNGGRHFGGGGWNNGGSWNNGWNGGGNWNNGGSGSGFNPGYNNGWNNGGGGGRCIRDSECPGSLKCCYLYNGYQCIQPQYYG